MNSALDQHAAERLQQRLAAERDHLRLLLEVTQALVAKRDLHDLLAAVSATLRRILPHRSASLAVLDEGTGQLVLHAVELERHGRSIPDGRHLSIEHSPSSQALTARRPVIAGDAELARWDAEVARLLRAAGVGALCCVPLVVGPRAVGTLNVGRAAAEEFGAPAVALLEEVAGPVAVAVDNALAFHAIARLTDRLTEERLYLEDEIRTERDFHRIVGDSPALRRVMEQVEVVAPTDSTVLILGETGTGKELVARALHDRSARRARAFVKLNCGAIPTGLLESELFGHERGAFTGAVARRIGRFEVANGGTLFLDEVGDIPLELQPKLLRVLQEREFERIGSAQTITVNVRLIAATNCDLARKVNEGRFRDDLYYRLNVFPIRVPPLREHAADIPTLVHHFAQRFSRQMNRRLEAVPGRTLDALRRYAWPGNVRELENLIERAVILSRGRTLEVPLADLELSQRGAENGTTLAAVERAHILRVLEETRWVVGGRWGAAARLGLKRTTLHSRMQRLGIAKPTWTCRPADT